jgi:DNA polymerase/3'-5' exonuclease PolX
MSEKKRYPYADALKLAEAIKVQLEPWCERIEIVGSLRRQKDMVGDIELLFIPKLETVVKDMFSEANSEMVDLCAKRIDYLLGVGFFEKRPSETNVFTWGPLNKLAIHKATGIAVDLFAEPNASDWARSMVIRTGPAKLNIQLIESGFRKGLRVHAYGDSLTKVVTGEVIPCASEEQFFKLCGMPWMTPRERSAVV